MLTHKQNVFDDFLVAAQFLIQEGYTSPEKLAIEGSSNGGLLVGAALTQRPDLFRAAVLRVPLLDMIRYPLFGQGKLWVPEYGSPHQKDQFQALFSYSPYHHVIRGTAYPSVLVICTENDDRADPMHGRKMAAALQAANPHGHPILLKTQVHSGHAGADVRKTKIEELVDRYTFLIHELDMVIPEDRHSVGLKNQFNDSVAQR